MAPRPAQLEVPWESRWTALRESLRVIFLEHTRRPNGAPADARMPGSEGSAPPGRALMLSAALHVLFIVTPLPSRFAGPPRPLAGTFRIEYDLNWASTKPLLPPIFPKRAQSRKPPRLKTPPVRVEAYHPQTIVSNPPEPNHPTQTLLAEFKAEAVRPRAVALPNIVIPPAPPEASKPAVSLPSPAFSSLLRPASPGELVLAETKLENLLPRLVVPPAGSPEASGTAPEPGASALPGHSFPEASGLPDGLVALSVNPARPTPSLEIPQTQLRARFAVGPKPGESRGFGSESGEETSGTAAASGMQAPDVVISGGLEATGGTGVIGPVIAGPAPPPPAPHPTGSAVARRESPRPEPGASRGIETHKSVGERARELLDGVTPNWPGKFGASLRRVYTATINMPNLTSQSSSWLLRFAEREAEPRSFGAASAEAEAGPAAAGDGAGNGGGISSPLAVRKVDPRYPADARRERVEGTVVLYAVIRADGGVEEVAVVRGVDARLDQSAAEAFARWRFQPARKNGQPIAIEVVIEIPFRLTSLL